MAQYSSHELDAVYHALSNATRRKILARLCKGSCTISELAEPFEITLAGVSKHIHVLEKSGLVRKRSEGTIHHCEIVFEPIRSAAGLIHYLEQFLPPEITELPQQEEAQEATTEEQPQTPAEIPTVSEEKASAENTEILATEARALKSEDQLA